MHPYLRSGLMTVAVAAALGLLALGFVSSGGDGDGNPPPGEIENVTPGHQAIITPQGEVGFDLVNDHTGVLLIDGQEVPEDQLARVDPLGQVFFSPGAGQDIERFRAGSHSATAVFWHRTQTRAEAESFTWLFRVG